MKALREVSLAGTWEMRDEPISCPADAHAQIAAQTEGWIPTPVPGDVRQGLIAAGRMTEPLEGLNSFDGCWVEDRSWWLRKKFTLPPAMRKAQAAELVLDGLDVNASIFLNGRHLGDHPSAFRPFVARVEKLLAEGENVLLVRLTHGLENVRPEQTRELGGWLPTEAGRGRAERGDPRRVFVRKAQYTWGWDWAPRAATVAIMHPPRLRLMNDAVIRDVKVTPCRSGKDVALNVAVQAEWLDFRSSGSGLIRVVARSPAGKIVARAEIDAMLQIGDNYIDLPLVIRNAKLWWPAGMGEQDRYTIETTLRAPGGAADMRSFRYGIRFLELEYGELFALHVNGRRIFCKGGNWIPPDSLYARVTDEKLDALVTEAKRANFNVLRVWGGGIYERDAFYEACDREGILVWHDFMFACAPYPDHLESFRDEVAKEADWQTRRLRNHCSMAVWSGSNECHYCLAIGKENETDKVTRLLGRVLPDAVRRNCPEIPYWYSSPSGGTHVNDPSVGDCHYWQIMMNKDIAVRITPEKFDECPALFVSEFGYPGPCGRETTLEYLAGAPFDRKHEVWQHHNNTFEKDTVDAGIAKHFADPAAMGPDEYLLYGGLTQGLMYAYELEALRALPRCHGAIFWMYDDAWGEVGWTIIDYYLRRKISWYFVRRALAHRRLILRAKSANVAVTLANDTAEPVRGRLEFGYLSLDGKVRDVGRKPFSVPAASRKVIASFARGAHDPATGVWFARVVGSEAILPATLRAVMPRELATRPKLAVSVAPAGPKQYDVTVATDHYARAVELLLPDGAVADDNYFELLPGENRTVRVTSPRRLTAATLSAACR